jgi:lysophospholipase L1-like esterase
MTTRRGFLAAAGGVAGVALLPGMARTARLVAAAAGADERAGMDAAPTTVLFQGDSITDWGRNRTRTGANDSSALGGGYPLLVAAALLERQPGKELRFYNRGISGNTVPDLAARWQQDTLDLKPDVLSILIGVNDIWHKLDGRYQGTVDDYRREYTELLDRTRRALPQVRLVVLEPFVLRTGAVNERWFPEFDERRAVAREVAGAARATFIPLQGMFDALAKKAPPAYWAADGVHPTPGGHEAIAREWMRRVEL